MKLSSLTFVSDHTEDNTYTIDNPERDFVPVTLTAPTTGATVKTKVHFKEPAAPGEPPKPLAAVGAVRMNVEGAESITLRLKKNDGTVVAVLKVN